MFYQNNFVQRQTACLTECQSVLYFTNLTFLLLFCIVHNFVDAHIAC